MSSNNRDTTAAVPGAEAPRGQGLSDADRGTLLRVARDSIAYGLRHGRSLPVDAAEFAETLRVPRASFVTLHIDGQLRGCIGTLEAVRPLVEDVAANAYSAAFSDPRFPPLTPAEQERLAIHVSVLGSPTAMQFDSEQHLIGQLRPGRDGLILEDGFYRGTFLPSVWESLPEPVDFLRHLKRKAGLTADYWSPTVKVYRYTTESFS
jgi:AmmeMemoRadiSam system protein A